MKISRSYGYKSYGSIPRNEYTNINQEQSVDAAVAWEDEQDDVANKRCLIKWKPQHRDGRRQYPGWKRSWKSNGWRAESAALQDEFKDMGRYSGYVRKSNRYSF